MDCRGWNDGASASSRRARPSRYCSSVSYRFFLDLLLLIATAITSHSPCLARRSPAVQPILLDFARLNRIFRRTKLTTHRSSVHRPIHPHVMTAAVSVSSHRWQCGRGSRNFTVCWRLLSRAYNCLLIKEILSAHQGYPLAILYAYTEPDFYSVVGGALIVG